MPAASMIHPAITQSIARPPKPLLRRSNLSGTVRKAEDAGLDADLLSAPPSPNKRARVSFNPHIEEKVMQGRSLDLIKAEVRRAIDGHARDDNEEYDILKDVFTPKQRGDDSAEDDTGDEIRKYVLALTTYVSLLGKGCSGLVKAVLDCEWLGRDGAFFKAYVHFLANLASAQGSYVTLVLVMLVKNFTGVRMSSGRLPGYSDVSREQLISRVHSALGYLLRVIPSASGTLSPILDRNFPFPDDSKKVHVTYIENLIQVIGYAPELKTDIYALITDRLVKIDVQTQVDLDDLDDEVTAIVVQAVSLQSFGRSAARELDQEESEDSDIDSVTSDEDIPSDAKRVKEIQGNVEKMDAILDLLFSLYEPYFSDPNSPEAASMFDTLLGHFQNIILPTYRSRHTQFLLFHFAQTSEHFVDQFAGTCIDLAFRANRPAVLKQSCAAYLASFVARGAHVQPTVVRKVFEVIGTNLDHIRTQNELSCRGPDLRRFGTFYAMTQALLYIFCFRWRDLIITSEVFDDDDPVAVFGQDLPWAPGIKETVYKTIHSKLNPLKICSPTIVAEFAKIANHLGFFYAYSIMDSNKRIRLSQFSGGAISGALRDTGNGSHSESWHQLDTYFPFDPYHLPVSKRWVEDDYVQWRGIRGLNHEDDDEDDESSEEGDADVGDCEEGDTATDDGQGDE
ncbi:RNA polymerase I specific transcription initiation factor RRN3 [Phlyctema vagabunda]|uniref:RNA polymerase I specific transcription initiation factor RRN3 n=1 Tax=Phlyctema vagabunda TaxID=108571 RepID=A0ABR4P6R1_9HELO